jgi:small-conductance mechanosensitive channel
VIEEINMKNVLIRGFDLRRVVVPNAKFLKRPVKTYNSENVLKLDFTCPVSRKLAVADALRLTQANVNTHSFVIHKELTQVLLDEYDDDEYVFKVIFCFDPNAGYTPDMMKSLVQV